MKMYLVILNKYCKLGGFKYKEGVNVYTNIDGLCFSDRENIAKFLIFGPKIATITIPDDTVVYAESGESGEWKANKIILSDIVPIGESALWNDPEFCKLAITQNGYALTFIPEKIKTEELCKIAITLDGYSLYDANKQTNELCKIAVYIRVDLL